MIGWPDLIIGGITIYFAIRGYAKGFVSELAGAVAIFIAVIAAFNYSGQFDGLVTAISHETSGSSHAVGLILWAILAYAIVMLISWALGRIAKLPVIGIVNGVAGALIGAGKALFGAFVVLYVVLFFPLPNDLRGDLHRSPLVQLVTQPDHQVDEDASNLMPWFIRPLAMPFFALHHV